MITMHYGRNLSFSPHPNIPDGKFNLAHHFIRVQTSRWKMKKGPVELGANLAEKKKKKKKKVKEKS